MKSASELEVTGWWTFCPVDVFLETDVKGSVWEAFRWAKEVLRGLMLAEEGAVEEEEDAAAAAVLMVCAIWWESQQPAG